MKNPNYINKRMLRILKKNTRLSPATAHKVMHPWCPECIAARGKQIVAERKK